MSFKVRLRGEDLYHHIYAWGNDRHAVFKEPDHYRMYLYFLNKYSTSFKLDIIAYALMEWHVHLFVYDRLNHISDFMMKLHGDYAQYFNRDAKRVGHVFGERYNNKLVANDLYGKWLTRYIHRQAVEAKLVEDPKEYQWTSYRVYLGLEKSKFLKPDVILEQFGKNINNWLVARQAYAEFVLSDDESPIDWGKRVFKVLTPAQIIDLVCRELKVKRSVLMKPQGIVERRLRHKAIKLLLEKYEIKASQVAEVFDMSRMAVSKIVNDIQ
jgi:putative transposase